MRIAAVISFLLAAALSARAQESSTTGSTIPHGQFNAAPHVSAAPQNDSIIHSAPAKNAYVQSSAKYLKLSYERGYCMPVDDKEIVNTLLKNSRYSNISVAGAWEVRPGSVYARIYRKPLLGVGFSAIGFDNSILGNPFMLYGFTEVPLTNSANRFHFSYGIGIGLAWGFNAYNKDSNPVNEAIGSNINPHLQASFNMGYWLTNKIRVSLGTGFRHFSNGSTKKPNAGINIIPVQLMVQYKMREVVHEGFVPRLPPFKKHWNYSVYFGGGMKQMYINEPMIHKATIGFNAGYHFSYKYALLGGFDMTYTSGSSSRVTEGSAFNKHFSFGPYIGWEWYLTERLFVPIHVGAYIHRNYENDETNGVYQRLGVKYLLLKDRSLSTGVALRSHFGNADFVEFSLGWHFGRH